jgi:hypothetical protein
MAQYGKRGGHIGVSLLRKRIKFGATVRLNRVAVQALERGISAKNGQEQSR